MLSITNKGVFCAILVFTLVAFNDGSYAACNMSPKFLERTTKFNLAS